MNRDRAIRDKATRDGYQSIVLFRGPYPLSLGNLSIFDILKTVGYVGWIIVETDRTMKPTAFESAKISRGYLASLGQ